MNLCYVIKGTHQSTINPQLLPPIQQTRLNGPNSGARLFCKWNISLAEKHKGFWHQLWENLHVLPIHFHKICWQNCLSKTKFIYTSTNCTYSLWREKIRCCSWHHLILWFPSDQKHHKNIFNELSVFWNLFSFLH